MTLVKSLPERLLSPFKVTSLSLSTRIPSINLASVPELPAFTTTLFDLFKLLRPNDSIS